MKKHLPVKFNYTQAEVEDPTFETGDGTYEAIAPPPRGPGNATEVARYNEWLETPPTHPVDLKQFENWKLACSHPWAK